MAGKFGWSIKLGGCPKVCCSEAAKATDVNVNKSSAPAIPAQRRVLFVTIANEEEECGNGNDIFISATASCSTVIVEPKKNTTLQVTEITLIHS